MRICLVNAPGTFELIGNDPVIIKDQQGVYPPLGIMFIAGYLRKHTDHEVFIIDAQAEDFSHKETAYMVAQLKPDLVGLTVMTFTLIDNRMLIDEIKKISVAKIVVGGPHCAIYPEESLVGLNADFCIVGEGEKTFVRLCQDIEMGKADNPIYRQETFIEDLDEIPFPARELTPINKYYSILAEHSPTTTAMSSRGCPYACTYCLDGDTLVMMSDGRWKKIVDVAIGDNVIGLDQSKNRGEFCKSRVTNKFPPREAELFEIKTKDGLVLATKEHPFLTEHKRWRRVDQLNSNRSLRFVSTPLESIQNSIDFKKGYMCGVLKSDGCFKKYPRGKHFRYWCAVLGDFEMMEAVFKISSELGVPFHKAKFSSKRFYNCHYIVKTNKRKHFEEIEKWFDIDSIEFKRGFITGFFDGDGSCTSSIRFHQKNSIGLSRVAEYLNQFKFSFSCKQYKRCVVLNVLGGSSEKIRFFNLFPNFVPGKRFSIVGGKIRNQSKIISIKSIGIRKVYNIETTSHNFIANGFISHNCDRPALGKNFRSQSANRVVDEMEWCEKNGIREIFFYDDTFTIKKQRVLDICKEYKRRGLKVRWDIRARVNTVDETILRELKSCNVTRIHFGVESSVPRILEELKKGITPEQVYRAFDTCHKLGIKTLAYFMMGTPTETIEDVKDNLKMVKRLRADYMQMTILSLFPATKVYDFAKKNGIVKGDPWLDYVKNPNNSFKPPVWDLIYTYEEHEAHLRWFYKKFYLRPRFIMERLAEIRSVGQFSRYFRAGLSLVRMSLVRESKRKDAANTIHKISQKIAQVPL